jgi:hypothetical protein
MKRLIAITGAMLLSTAVFFVAASAGDSMVTKPVKGQFSGTDYTVGVCTNGEGLVVNVGKGVATEFGESDLLAVGCISCTDSTCESFGWMIVTAANGDALHLETYGTTNLENGEWTEVETVVGGTGKFKNATGDLVTKGYFVLPTDPDLFFPWNTSILPSLLQEPTFWVGTTDGYITY